MASDYGTLGGVSALGAVDAWSRTFLVDRCPTSHIRTLAQLTCRRASTPAPTPTQPPRQQHGRSTSGRFLAACCTDQDVVSILERYDG
jgi:hypothetical protein